MISKSTIKLIKSLAVKKYRLKEKMFLVEGDKNVLEVIHSQYHIQFLYATNHFISENKEKIKHLENVIETPRENIKKASLLKNPQNCIAICEIKETPNSPIKLDEGLYLFLDGIQDPGNFGTIIRVCDWFGIQKVFCTSDTVDFYSPKVIQSSMGSFCRVKVRESTFEQINKVAMDLEIPTYGTFLNGKNIYDETLPKSAIIILGNEGNGIKESIEKEVSNKITIPKFVPGDYSADSLNVGIATGIICAEFRRQNIL